MKRFFARLRGSEEVPRVRTHTSGAAAFQLSGDGRRLRFISMVKDIRGVPQVHFHLGRKDGNDPVEVFLFGPISRGILVDGGAVTGTITSIDVTNPIVGRSLSVLVREMRNGSVYVNVKCASQSSSK